MRGHKRSTKSMDKKAIRYWIMNHEITRMLRKGYSFSSIAQTTGIDHCSVKKYASMSEAEFTGFLENKESRTRLLIDYEAFVKDRLLDTPAPCYMPIARPGILFWQWRQLRLRIK